MSDTYSGHKRPREEPRGRPGTETRERNKRIRWDDHGTKTFVPGVPTYIPHELSQEQLEALLVRIRIEEIGYKIANQMYDVEFFDSGKADEVFRYDQKTGKRINANESAAKQRLIDERHWLIEKAFKINPNFLPPNDFRIGATKLSRKIYVPVDEFPDYNFVGLVIGPRGMTQKQLEKDTQCKISIRGKGSGKDGRPADDPDDDMHILITGETVRSVKHASKIIRKLITPMDEEENHHKAAQLRKLAEIHGTIKAKTWEPIYRTYKTADIYCKHCGEISHITSDCPLKKQPLVSQAAVDEEYDSFMKEIGLGDDGGPQPAAQAEKNYEEFMNSILGQGPGAAAPAAPVAPWLQSSTPAAPVAPWAQAPAAPVAPWAAAAAPAPVANPAAVPPWAAAPQPYQ